MIVINKLLNETVCLFGLKTARVINARKRGACLSRLKLFYLRC